MSHALAVIRSLAVLGSVAALACGGQDSGKTSQPAAPPGAAKPAANPAAPGPSGGMPGVQAAAPPAGAIHPSVTSCLDLVQAGRYAEAIAPCTVAAQNAPTNADVRAALEQARSQAAASAAQAAAGAAQEATGAAQDAAGKAAADAVGKGLPAGLPTR